MALVKSKHGRCRTIRTCSCPGCDNLPPLSDAAPLMGWRCSPATTSTTTSTTTTTTTAAAATTTTTTTTTTKQPQQQQQQQQHHWIFVYWNGYGQVSYVKIVPQRYLWGSRRPKCTWFYGWTSKVELEKLYETHFPKHHGKEAKEAILVGSNGFHSVALRIQSPSQNGFMQPKYYSIGFGGPFIILWQ